MKRKQQLRKNSTFYRRMNTYQPINQKDAAYVELYSTIVLFLYSNPVSTSEQNPTKGNTNTNDASDAASPLGGSSSQRVGAVA
ncbi:hypothetical protein ARMSODRAFT_964068 [Armillaria solidipes]|uniref:Uncharacterized protein n=1 Tax=Armillaria solidipes TaxID=1076256 RepID=A0A2H3B957_9AGAR|nr:hypothetical protein ARMSODRAFT_964068 [Armillaria solidipes]